MVKYLIFVLFTFGLLALFLIVLAVGFGVGVEVFEIVEFENANEFDPLSPSQVPYFYCVILTFLFAPIILFSFNYYSSVRRIDENHTSIRGIYDTLAHFYAIAYFLFMVALIYRVGFATAADQRLASGITIISLNLGMTILALMALIDGLYRYIYKKGTHHNTLQIISGLAILISTIITINPAYSGQVHFIPVLLAIFYSLLMPFVRYMFGA